MIYRRCLMLVATFLMLASLSASVHAQKEEAVILTGAELARIVPPGFYFEGQSAPTQMRNAAVARLGAKQYVIAGMVDTSGYSSEIRAKYEGFFITDAAVSVGTGVIPAGAYGFGFTEAGQFNLFDVGGNPLLTVETTNDAAMTRPRPLMMSATREGMRLYSGRRYVLITTRPKEEQL